MSCIAPCYPETAAETAAAVVITNFNLPPGNVKRYGAYGDGSHPDDAAIGYALSQSYQPDGSSVYFPRSNGEYIITAAINITASVSINGECDRLSTTGPRIVQQGNAELLSITGSSSLSLALENMSFGYAGPPASSSMALVYVAPSVALNPSSFYFKNCWFQVPSFYALNISNCNDVQILGCTFDVTAQSWLSFGLNGLVKSVSIVGCTLFDQTWGRGLIDLGRVDGFVFEANRVYRAADNTLTAYVINATSGTVNNLIVQGNVFEACKEIVTIGSSVTATIISNNVAVFSVTGASTPGPLIVFGGSAISSVSVTGNVLSGSAGSGKGLIDATGTNVGDCVIVNNIISGASASDYAINLPSTTSGNRIASNVTSGWNVRSINTPAYANNGIVESGTCTLTLTGVSGTAPTGICKYSVVANSVTLTIPVISGTSSSTSATLTGLWPFLSPSSVQSFLITVTNAGTNILGAISIGTSGTLSLYADAAYGGFTASGLKGLQACAITFQLG